MDLQEDQLRAAAAAAGCDWTEEKALLPVEESYWEMMVVGEVGTTPTNGGL